MRFDKYFIVKAGSLFVIVGLIFLCNAYLNKENTIKAAALEKREKQIKEYEEKLAQSEKAGADFAKTGSQTVNEESAGKYVDGTYDGEAQGFGGLIQVRVAVEQGKIAEVELLYADKEDTAYLESAVNVIEEMETSGDTDVDTVSGATYSSAGIINAAKAALKAAEK